MFKSLFARPVHWCSVSVLALATLTAACDGGSGGGSGDRASADRKGRFLDSAVHGLRYATSTQSGTTDVDGGFDYQSGESVRFWIGDIPLPQVAAAPLMSPLDVFKTDDPFDFAVVNLARLLQSLDADGDPENGIDLTQMNAALTRGLEIDFRSQTFADDVVNLVANSPGPNNELIAGVVAASHLQNTIAANGLGASGCTSDHPLVGAKATFETRFHDVVGEAEVLDDCTVEITGFGYDGEGPDVSFYFAANGNFSFDSYPVGPRLNGTIYSNDTIRLKIPDGITLNDANSISVWCHEFSISFGDLIFEAGASSL